MNKKSERPANYRKPKRHTQIAVYAPGPLLALVSEEAHARRRKLGPMVLEILWEYFNKKKEEAALAKADA